MLLSVGVTLRAQVVVDAVREDLPVLGGGRARMQENLRWYLYEHLGYAPGETVTIPYTTLVWLARL